MNQCLTLVANTSFSQEELLQILPDQVAPLAVQQRNKNVWDVAVPANMQLSDELRSVFYQHRLDFALQDEKRAAKKVFLSDMDATMVVGETIDEMAELVGAHEAISAITQQAMLGDMDFIEALTKRLALLKGIPKQDLVKLAQQVALTPTAKALLDDINDRHISSCLVSGGFSLFTEIVSQRLGFQQHLANELSFDEDGQFDGRWVGDVVTAETKAAKLRSMAAESSVSLAETVAIGDGANDMEMVQQAGLGVAFYGKPALRAVSNAEIHSGTIDHLKWFL